MLRCLPLFLDLKNISLFELTQHQHIKKKQKNDVNTTNADTIQYNLQYKEA